MNSEKSCSPHCLPFCFPLPRHNHFNKLFYLSSQPFVSAKSEHVDGFSSPMPLLHKIHHAAYIILNFVLCFVTTK